VVLDGSVARNGRFCEPFRFVIPKAQFLTIHLDHNGSVLPSGDEATGGRQIIPLLCGSRHLNPMRVMVGLAQPAHLRGTNL